MPCSTAPDSKLINYLLSIGRAGNPGSLVKIKSSVRCEYVQCLKVKLKNKMYVMGLIIVIIIIIKNKI